jgi:imidazole glycerol-phosphate synthase subunit HisH
MTTAIIDYKVGNLASLQAGFMRAGIDTVISSDATVLQQADVLVLPGVGAFGPAMEALRATELIPIIKQHVAANKPLLGICLGMQLLYEGSEEFGVHQGLGLLRGIIQPIKHAPKVPHMGWNTLTLLTESSLFTEVVNGDYVYFVHSYQAPMTDAVMAMTSYTDSIPAIVSSGVVVGMQFHPEKSARVGEQLLRNFGRWASETVSRNGSL